MALPLGKTTNRHFPHRASRKGGETYVKLIYENGAARLAYRIGRKKCGREKVSEKTMMEIRAARLGSRAGTGRSDFGENYMNKHPNGLTVAHLALTKRHQFNDNGEKSHIHPQGDHHHFHLSCF